MPHPRWVLKHRAKGTEIKKIGDNYYLYSVTSKWDKELKQSKKITGKFLGKIILQGIVHQRENSIAKHGKNLSIKEFGATNFFYKILDDVIKKINIYFPLEWQEIIVIAFIRILYQSPLKNIEMLYNQSYISIIFPNLKLNGRLLNILFKNIGDKREKIIEFMQSFYGNEDNVLFD